MYKETKMDIYIYTVYMWYIYAWCTCILPGWLWKMKLRFNRQSMWQIRSRKKNCTLHRNRRPLPRKLSWVLWPVEIGLSIYKSRDSSKSGFPSTPTTCFQLACHCHLALQGELLHFALCGHAGDRGWRAAVWGTSTELRTKLRWKVQADQQTFHGHKVGLGSLSCWEFNRAFLLVIWGSWSVQ